MPRKKIIPTGEALPDNVSSALPEKAQKPRRAAAKSNGTDGRDTRRKASGGSRKSKPAEGSGAAALLESAVSEHEQIALLAYSYWEARGYMGGSPDDDWYRAEREIRSRREQFERTQ